MLSPAASLAACQAYQQLAYRVISRSISIPVLSSSPDSAHSVFSMVKCLCVARVSPAGERPRDVAKSVAG
jgi:hypothetical protein